MTNGAKRAIRSVEVRIVHQQAFRHGSRVELVIRRDKGQPGEALRLPGDVHRKDSREMHGIIATEGIRLRKLYGLRDQTGGDVNRQY